MRDSAIVSEALSNSLTGVGIDNLTSCPSNDRSITITHLSHDRHGFIEHERPVLDFECGTDGCRATGQHQEPQEAF